ncbi:hypothetical protein ACT15_24690 [Klebsiella pneumoniae]|nr:hypothetical protein ACT15_24690 [Klebsiella pneumoniae]
MFSTYTGADLLGKEMIDNIDGIGRTESMSPCPLHNFMDTLFYPSGGFGDSHPRRTQNIRNIGRRNRIKRNSPHSWKHMLFERRYPLLGMLLVAPSRQQLCMNFSCSFFKSRDYDFGRFCFFEFKRVISSR